MAVHQYLPSAEAGRRLGISSNTIINWCRRGLLQYTTVTLGTKTKWFVLEASFNELLEVNQVSPEPVTEKTNSAGKPGRPSKFRPVEGA